MAIVLSLTLLVALTGLLLVLCHVLLLELSHPLDFIKIDHEAFFVTVELLDALTAKNRKVIAAVEVSDSLRVLLTELFIQGLFVIILEVKAGLAKNRILLDNFIKYVDIQRKSLGRLELLNKFSTDWASNTILVVKLLDAIGT